MQLESLRLQNFRQHENTELTLSAGVTAVVGVNGSGKSTLLEAIAWALYGAAAARGRVDSIKRRGAGSGDKVEVVLVFTLGEHRYQITRNLTKAVLQQDGQTIANSTGTVTERIVSLLGMSREEFFNTYFTGQKELAVMAAMTPAERGRFLAHVLGYDRLRLAQDRLRSERSTRRAELAGLEQGLADPEELEQTVVRAAAELDRAREIHEVVRQELEVAEAAVQALAPEWERLRAARTAWQGLDGEQRAAEARVTQTRTTFQGLDRELATAVAAESERERLALQLVDWPTLVARREALEQQAALVTARSRTVAERDAARNQLQTVVTEAAQLPDDAVLQKAAEALRELTAARTTCADVATAARTRWTQDEQEARTKLEQYRDRYRELREQHAAIRDAGPNGTCPYCARPLGVDHEHTLARLTSEMDEVEASGQYYKQRVDQLAKVPDALNEAQAALLESDERVRVATEQYGTTESGVARRRRLIHEAETLRTRIIGLESELEGPAASYDAEEHREIRERMAVLEPVRRRHDEAAGIAARAATLVHEAAAAEVIATEAEAVLEAINVRVTALGWQADLYQAHESKVEKARVAQEAARLNVANAAGAVETKRSLRDEAVARRADRMEKGAAVTRVNAQVERLTELDHCFGDLRAMLNQEMRPELQSRAAEFLATLTDGRYDDLEINEDYQVAIVDGREVKPVISGGEEDVLNLALRLAISQMIAERAGQPLSLLVLDEIFGSLDDDRRQAVVDLLRALGDRFPQVIVISHVDSLRDMFDRVLRVSYDVERGVTTVQDDQPELLDVVA